eukprot:TRINITY_DN3988_c0_g1_i1.p2 TRINITY_DN3988_c0_g1~~TRINITY_DN3988_c0_g1_i1.p2  ORF type:complete len:128 (+),score=9.41 TRINITY_DN3988_c0_g1_i1:446-829(+)
MNINAWLFYFLNDCGLCTACLRCFHHPFRLRDHFRSSQGCLRQVVLGGGGRLSSDEAEAMIISTREAARQMRSCGWSERKAHVPFVRFCGPLNVLKSGPIDLRGYARDMHGRVCRVSCPTYWLFDRA